MPTDPHATYAELAALARGIGTEAATSRRGFDGGETIVCARLIADLADVLAAACDRAGRLPVAPAERYEADPDGAIGPARSRITGTPPLTGERVYEYEELKRDAEALDALAAMLHPDPDYDYVGETLEGHMRDAVTIIRDRRPTL